MMGMFHYLKLGLGGVLSFIGVKMLLGHTAWKIDTLVALGVVAAILTASIIASLVHAARARARLSTLPSRTDSSEQS
jgi:tellurite resistance protein TerC